MNGLLGDLPEFQQEMRGMQVLNQPIPQQQPQPRGDVSFLEKMAIFLAPTAYQNISNVKSMRQQEAGTQGMDLPNLVDYWSTRDPQKAQQYANILQQQKAQQAEQARQQSMQEVLGGVAPTQATGNQGYSEQAENLARAGIQLMQRGDLVGGEALIKQAQQLQELRTKRDSVNLGNRVAMIDPFSDGQMSIGVSPDASLSAATTRRGQDLAMQRFNQQQAAKTAPKTDDQVAGAAREVGGSLGRVKRLLGESATTGLSGRIMGATGLPTSRKALESELESLQSQLAFAEIARLKGLGVTFGALSDAERIAVGRSVANLDPNQPESALRAQLQRVYDKFSDFDPEGYGQVGSFISAPSTKTRGQGASKPRRYNPATGMIE